MTTLQTQPIVFRDATDIARRRLCVGCGACVYACQNQRLTMRDIPGDGLRPVITAGDCSGCTDCVAVCPGVGAAHATAKASGELINELTQSWGPVLEVWEGHATDALLRFGGSSGGLASALALHGIEEAGMRGLLHVVPDEHERHRNRTAFSHTRAEILAATGSKYAPASPCDSLQLIEDAGGACVFIGKPCDVEALRKAEALRPALRQNVGIAIGIFCAGTPSTQGTIDLLKKFGIDPGQVEEIRYRGRGWPGSFAVRLAGDPSWRELATYAEAWGFLQRYRPYRCYLCPDGTSEFADIACGDPWYRDIADDEPGLSLVVVRTERGRAFVRSAMRAGAVQLTAVDPQLLQRSQQELQFKRGAIWGRLLTLRALGVAAPRFEGFSLFANWLKIPWRQQLRSTLGTARRVFTRRYHRLLDYPWRNDKA